VALEVSYNTAMQPLVRVSVGGQWLDLVFDASSGDTLVFVKEYHACRPESFQPCYSAEKAGKSLRVCEDNLHAECSAGRGYSCSKFLPGIDNATAHPDELVIDGLRYVQKSVEALDAVQVALSGPSPWAVGWRSMPVRLLVQPLAIPEPHPEVTLRLFEGSSGLLGASGPSLSCRGENVWTRLLETWNVSVFALDFQPPPQAPAPLDRDVPAPPGNGSSKSRVVLGHVDPRFKAGLMWSQPKQTGDILNDAMSEFLMYRPSVCGVDLLYNTSSNWLTVLDTSGPCLLLPPFLFDRLRAHLPVTCPFEMGQPSKGRLCSPDRSAGGGAAVLLPALSFKLEDVGEPSQGAAEARKVEVPLERLVFRNASGKEFLCISRDDDAPDGAADMLFTHISLGSLAVAAVYTVVDLEAHRVGLASRGNASVESTDRFCKPRQPCKAMQTYYPPQNVCENPLCSRYLFMTLDADTKTCIWSRSVPALFGVLLAALVALDLVGHRLYAQATEKAGGLRLRQ